MRYLLPDVLATHFAYTKVRLEYSNVAPTLASEKRKAIFLSGFKEALKVNLSNAPLELLEGKKGKKKKKEKEKQGERRRRRIVMWPCFAGQFQLRGALLLDRAASTVRNNHA